MPVEFREFVASPRKPSDSPSTLPLGIRADVSSLGVIGINYIPRFCWDFVGFTTILLGFDEETKTS